MFWKVKQFMRLRSKARNLEPLWAGINFWTYQKLLAYLFGILWRNINHTSLVGLPVLNFLKTFIPAWSLMLGSKADIWLVCGLYQVLPSLQPLEMLSFHFHSCYHKRQKMEKDCIRFHSIVQWKFHEANIFFWYDSQGLQISSSW